MITADTITDEQIRELLARGIISADLAVETGAKLSGGQWYAPKALRRAARARCAEILNSRSGIDRNLPRILPVEPEHGWSPYGAKS